MVSGAMRSDAPVTELQSQPRRWLFEQGRPSHATHAERRDRNPRATFSRTEKPKEQPRPTALRYLNIGTLTGRSRELSDALKRRRIDFVCVQEVKWTGGKAVEIGEGFKFFYSGGRLEQNGVGIAVCEQYRNDVTEVHRVSDRLMSIKIECGTAALRIVACYTQQQGRTDDVKETLWRSIEEHLHSFGADEHIVIGGDLNGHVGHTRDGYERHHGGEGFGERNEEGASILDFEETHDLALANTYFKKRDTHRVTYSSGLGWKDEV